MSLGPRNSLGPAQQVSLFRLFLSNAVSRSQWVARLKAMKVRPNWCKKLYQRCWQQRVTIHRGTSKLLFYHLTRNKFFTSRTHFAPRLPATRLILSRVEKVTSSFSPQFDAMLQEKSVLWRTRGGSM